MSPNKDLSHLQTQNSKKVSTYLLYSDPSWILFVEGLSGTDVHRHTQSEQRTQETSFLTVTSYEQIYPVDITSGFPLILLLCKPSSRRQDQIILTNLRKELELISVYTLFTNTKLSNRSNCVHHMTVVQGSSYCVILFCYGGLYNTDSKLRIFF